MSEIQMAMQAEIDRLRAELAAEREKVERLREALEEVRPLVSGANFAVERYPTATIVLEELEQEMLDNGQFGVGA